MNGINQMGIAALVSACELFSVGVVARETPSMYEDSSLVASYLAGGEKAGEKQPTRAEEEPLQYSHGIPFYAEPKRQEDERLLQNLRRV